MWEVLQLQQGAATLEVCCEYDQLQSKNISSRAFSKDDEDDFFYCKIYKIYKNLWGYF